jgi:hypothetical protein
MIRLKMHKSYCFAGQPAPGTGYFDDDVLPCVCGVSGDVLSALSQVAVPVIPIGSEVPAEIHLLPLSA